MRCRLFVTLLLLSLPGAAFAQLSIQIGLPDVRIRFSQPEYPQLVAVPGYPVYYDPSAASNYFFYDGLYWVYEGDTWYASSWYDGPWGMVAPEAVPYFILRVPVRYYREPPAYFRSWQADAPPRWGEHWGRDWERQRGGWDRWDRRQAPAPAPLPTYQRQYAGNRYPQPEQQQALRAQHDRREPRDAAVKQVWRAQTQRAGPTPAPAQPARPPEHVQPVRPPAQAQPVRPPAQAQPVRPPERAQPVRPPERAQPVRPPEHAQPVRPPEHAQPVRPPEQERPSSRPNEAPQQGERRPQAPRPEAQPQQPKDAERGKQPQGKGHGQDPKQEKEGKGDDQRGRERDH